MQRIITIENGYVEFEKYIKDKKIKKIFCVSGKSAKGLPIQEVLDRMSRHGDVQISYFSDYQSNPTYESVYSGVQAYRECEAECIMAIGGGSAIDVAKCIKAYANCEDTVDYTEQQMKENRIPFVVIPTTAGTGSEATHFAVIYKNGEKLSVAHENLIPETVIMDPANLDSLPNYQKVVTMLDAWGHAVEAMWSLRATTESDKYAMQALQLVVQHQDSYLLNEKNGNSGMQKAAYYAGKAINISQTTAAHAMSYKLTSLYGLPHGHAVALCLSHVWKNVQENCEQMEIADKLKMISDAMGCNTVKAAIDAFDSFLVRNNIESPKCSKETDLELLKSSVNQQRLKNYPIHLSEEDIEKMYRKILGWSPYED